MDLSPSEASSPFVHNQADQSKDLKYLPITSDGFIDYLTPKRQFYQSEPSKVSAQKAGRVRRRKKIETDRKYRMKKKVKFEDLTTENGILKTEFNWLTEEIRQLKEDITRLHPDRKFPAQDLKKLESDFSQSTSQQHDNRSVSVQFSGFQMSHGVQDLQKISSINEGVAVNEYLTKNKESSLSVIWNDSISITQLLTKIDADDKSNVHFSDFPGLSEEECLAVEGSSLPRSLCATSQRLWEAYGDITAMSKFNANVSRIVYILFCATIKEMDDLQLEQVTENKILKWRDAIKDALRIGFLVDFAMEHLKKIACAYVGLVLQRKLECMAVSISKLEADLKNKREEHAKVREQAKLYKDSLEEFSSKSVSSGLFP
ncbi:hypothetical protein REPUB_Repub11eG0045400 [Reevesia pubescens]